LTALAVGPAVAAALAEGRPVVALESAIITHGLPRPRNLEVARELEDRLWGQGVVPATVGVIDGVPTVGVGPTGLHRLATAGDVAGAGSGSAADGTRGAGSGSAADGARGAGSGSAADGAGSGSAADAVTKVSIRDLPVVMALGGTGGTTVAATAWLARRAGVRVFAPGGLGGVHRGASQSFDESADLPTLASTPITVVCAGVKSILDVAATLERLETFGVTVVGYRTRVFPGFYVTDSGLRLADSVAGADEVVAIMAAGDQLGLRGAVVIANPVPEDEQLDPVVHDTVIAEALAAAAEAGIRGAALTPFLLDRLQLATGGASLEANLAAVRHNVTVAGEIALAWSAAAAAAGQARPSPVTGDW
jgi:pseudouridine-5'-phosphate glycosidase